MFSYVYKSKQHWNYLQYFQISVTIVYLITISSFKANIDVLPAYQ